MVVVLTLIMAQAEEAVAQVAQAPMAQSVLQGLVVDQRYKAPQREMG